MAKKSKKLNEEELRNQIQKQLNEEFEEGIKKDENEEQASFHFDNSSLNAEVEEHYLREYLEEEICSQYPEFIPCENHLNEIKWLTPHELDDEHEYYPVEESSFKRFYKRLFKKKKMPNISDPELKNRLDAIRTEISADVEKRLQDFKTLKKELEKSKSQDVNQKIYQEEIDKFYSRKKGYKKYINHLGETKWLNKEEHKNQDEFIEEVETKSQIWLRRILYLSSVIVIALVLWVVIFFSKGTSQPRAYLTVTTNDVKAQLYVDKVLAAGFTPGQPYAISAGEHNITLIREGYESIPKFHTIDVAAKDTTQVAFEMKENRLGEAGQVFIRAPYPDAGIIVNGEFRGTLATISSLKLAAGDYTLMLEKPGYIASPPQRAFSLKDGDTLDLSFRFTASKRLSEKQSGANRIESGLLEVRSNIKNAEIYLDGQKTSFVTDYILQQIPLGSHVVRVEKEGHKTYPEEQRVKISEKNRHVVADFTLTSTFKRITIKTQPVKGDIFVNGKKVGNGEASVSLPLGEHSITFGSIGNYQSPTENKIVISQEMSSVITFNYSLNYHVAFMPDKTLPNAEMASVKLGYLLTDDEFRQSQQAGPEVRLNKVVNENVWMLGYAFQYRNPPGRDALILNFFIPNNLDLSQPLYLKLWAYRSKDLYPLKLKRETYFSIDVNRFRLDKSVNPRFNEEQIDGANFEQFKINELLRPGYNQIMITTTAATSAHLMLWKAAIE